MDYKKFTSANRAAWEEAAPIHAGHNQEQALESFSEPGYVCFSELEQANLRELGVKGKDVAQICCNNGRELISIKNMGAAHCVGFDGSQGFIDQAMAINQAAGTDCDFVCTDIYDIDQHFDAQFDLLVITIGVLGWMPDLDQFFNVLTRLMRPGSHLYIHEQHPILDMIEPGGPDDPVSWDYSYFKQQPFIENDGLDYYGHEKYESKTLYCFTHPLADIFTFAINNRLNLKTFREYPEHISNTWYNVEKQGPDIPMSYLAVFQRN